MRRNKHIKTKRRNCCFIVFKFRHELANTLGCTEGLLTQLPQWQTTMLLCASYYGENLSRKSARSWVCVWELRCPCKVNGTPLQPLKHYNLSCCIANARVFPSPISMRDGLYIVQGTTANQERRPSRFIATTHRYPAWRQTCCHGDGGRESLFSTPYEPRTPTRFLVQYSVVYFFLFSARQRSCWWSS